MKTVEYSMTEYKYKVKTVRNSSKNPLRVQNSWHEAQIWHSAQNMMIANSFQLNTR